MLGVLLGGNRQGQGVRRNVAEVERWCVAFFGVSKMKKLVLSVALAVIAASGAQAADPPMYVDPVLAEDPAMDWTGPYVGPRVTITQRQPRVFILDPVGILFVGPNGPVDNTYSATSIGGGGQAGFLFQTGKFVLGVQGDVEWYGNGAPFVPVTSGFLGDDYRVTINALGTVQAKAGIAINQFLLYATGGVAIGSVQTVYRAPSPVVAADFTRTQFGYTVGVGGEVAVTEMISLFAEYRYTDLGSSTGPVGAPFPAGSTATTSVRAHTGVVGINFRP